MAYAKPDESWLAIEAQADDRKEVMLFLAEQGVERSYWVPAEAGCVRIMIGNTDDAMLNLRRLNSLAAMFVVRMDSGEAAGSDPAPSG